MAPLRPLQHRRPSRLARRLEAVTSYVLPLIVLAWLALALAEYVAEQTKNKR